jgi:hypothetical protein
MNRQILIFNIVYKVVLFFNQFTKSELVFYRLGKSFFFRKHLNTDTSRNQSENCII